MTVQQTGYFDVGRRLPYGEDLNNLLDGKQGADTGATALGTALASAYKIIRSISQFSSVPSSTGAALPSALTLQATKSPTFSITNILGKTFIIYNDDSANALQVYAPDASTIDGVAGATGVALTHAKAARFTAIAVSTAGVVTWKSNLLGAVSS